MVGFLTATAAGFLGRLWWGFDLLAALRLQVTVALALLAVVGAVGRRRGVALACLAGVVANAVVIAPLFLPRSAATAPGAPVLRVMSLNVRVHEADPAAVTAHLLSAREDLVFLFAASSAWVRTLADADVPYDIAFSAPPGVDLEIVVLSRRAVRDAVLHRWGPSNRSSAVEVTADLDGRPVKVLGLHPVSPMGAHRARIHGDTLAAAARWSAGERGARLVVGDLNATPWSHHFRLLLREGDLVDSQRGIGPQPSWPARLGPLGIPIDHALHSSELVTVERSLGPSFGSAHRSVRVGVAFGH